ncbi:T9SS type A sorting domain-containing protein [Tamlana fucoidanivorans]|uniref:T9SS type A sorting domain-containing protein n=1 Tax=Allotamlana fucoidanivorans TaxID=2583814 RepID=A0A5C4SNT0_9FLAO|nr:T9SS type A sorting domain-containing protein [Tamlana fucoidanivorans]TNJ44964.1 T9SS type A sorting domain-containing protein [Tamlana fucoidanivorans]
MKNILFVLFLLKVMFVSAQSLQHPIIHITADERAEVLDKINKYSWAQFAQNELKKNVDAKVAAHKSNPAQTINAIIALAVDDNLAESEVGSANNEHFKVLSSAAHAGMLYYLTEDEDYAQYAADIIWHYFQELAPRTPETTAICGNYFFDPRSTYPYLAYAYDFIYNFLNTPGTQVYDKTAGTRIAYSNETAQKAMKNVAGNALLESGGVDNKYGKLVSNHPILTAPGALAAILCIDDDTERERLFKVFWDTGTQRQNSFTRTVMPIFGEQGIWPESTSYSFMSRIQLVLNMVDRIKPELDVIPQYRNVLDGVFLFENLRHPNRSYVRYGDSKRYNDGSKSLFRYVLSIAKRKGYTDLQDKAETALAQYYNVEGGRNQPFGTSAFGGLDHLGLFWGEEFPLNSTQKFDYKPTVIVKHAGVALQRNYTETNNELYGLCGIIGGAHYVHSHATGITMELYGLGDIMAPNGGMPISVAERKLPIHTNYFRIYAGNNTVIVNGNSKGRQSGSWASNSYVWQNTTVNKAAEPAHLEDPLSTNFSFATQFLDDNINNCDQQRTLSTIRTSPTTAYYFDIFRSKSLNTNNFHDYIYHNIGDATTIKTLDGSTLPVSATNRYQNDVGDPVQSPGWRFFENTNVTEPTNEALHIRFDLDATNSYMNMFAPAGVTREYTKALGPATREALNGYVKKKTQVLAIRQQGEAWDKPYVYVFEPSKSTNPSVKSVSHIMDGEVIAGAKVISEVNGAKITDYIFSNASSTSVSHLDINFTGEFGIVRTAIKDGKTNVSLYLGKGSTLKFLDEIITGDTQDKAFKEFVLNYEYFSNIPENNFRIEVNSETCSGKNNGKITINALEKFNYEVSLNNVNYEFTNQTVIENLTPGSYDFCIGISGNEFKQCYQVTVDEAPALTGKISSTKTGKVAIEIEKGNAPFKVIKNGVLVLETAATQFTIDGEQGDEIVVKSDAECQGKIMSTIDFLSNVQVYPNPTQNTFTIVSGKADWAQVSIYNILGLQVYSNNQVQNKLVLNAQDHHMTSGMYFVSIQNQDGKIHTFKLMID